MEASINYVTYEPTRPVRESYIANVLFTTYNIQTPLKYMQTASLLEKQITQAIMITNE
jgi:hypothetical protein